VPTDVFVRATDTDGVTSYAKAHEGGVKVVSGRIKVSNAYGSELLPLTLSATAQYYGSAGGWVTSSTDSTTAISLGSFTYDRKTGTTWTTTPTPTLMSGESSPATWKVLDGLRKFSLSAPNTGNTGNVTVPTNAVGTYLPIASGRATFGVYKGNSNFIYMRESY
jgi:MSHA biogenesis protein MshQ